MDRGEAIKILEHERDTDIFVSDYRNRVHEALDLAIEALGQEPSEGCISREWLIEEIARRDTTDGAVKVFGGREINEIILNAPSVAPKEKIGTRKEEEKQSVYGKKIRLTCRECGDVVDVSESAYPYEKYCRYCGAKMKG